MTCIPFPTNPDTAKCLSLLFEVIMCNPGGDPDNGGAPHVDGLTGQGFQTQYSMKRMVRDIAHDHYGRDLYIGRGDDLTVKQTSNTVEELGCLFDVRVFGGALTQHKRHIAGPFVVRHAKSLDPVIVQDCSLTRVAGTWEEGKDGKEGRLINTMGRFQIVTYGLYRTDIYIDPFKAAKTGMTEEDLAIAYDGFINGWVHNKSANRSGVFLRRAYLFDYGTKRSSLPDHAVNRWVRAEKVEGVQNPTKFEDYEITVDLSKMRSEMTFHAWEDGEISTQKLIAAK